MPGAWCPQREQHTRQQLGRAEHGNKVEQRQILAVVVLDHHAAVAALQQTMRLGHVLIDEDDVAVVAPADADPPQAVARIGEVGQAE